MLKRLSMILCVLWCIFIVRMVFIVGQTAGKEELAEAFSQMVFRDLEIHTELNGELKEVADKEAAVTFMREAMEIFSLGSETPILVETKENGMVWTAKGKLISEKKEKKLNTELNAGSTELSEESNVERNVQPNMELNIESDIILDAEDTESEIMLSVIAIQDGFYTRYYFQAAANTHKIDYELSAIRPSFEKLKSKLHLDSIINTCYCASYGRLLTQTEKENFETGLLSYLSAEPVSKFSENNMQMVYAYQKGLGDSVLLEGEKVNLNIIIRDNLYETLCFVGIPVVQYDD